MTRTPLDPSELRPALGLFALSVLVTLIFAAPVLEAPSERLIGREIVGRHHDAYNYIQRFESPPRWHYYTQFATDWPGSLLGQWLGGVAAYNLIVLLTFPLTSLATYLLARHLGAGRPPAALAALLFAFAPFHIAHSAYHPHIAQLQWLPLSLLAMFSLLGRPGPKTALGFIGAGILLVTASFYNSIILVCVFPAGAVAYWLACPPGERTRARRGMLAVLAIVVGFVAGGVMFLAFTNPEVIESWHGLGFPVSDLSIYSARFWSYLAPPVGHALLGGLADRFWLDHPLRDGLVEHQLFLGGSLLALAFFALIGRAKGNHVRQRQVTLVALGVVAFTVSLPPALDIGSMTVPFPSAFLHGVAPMFRAYARVGAVVGLVVALLAALGLTGLLGRRGWKRGLGIGLALVAILELAPIPPWRWHDVLPTRGHRWLARQTGALQILDCVRPTRGEQSVTALMPHPTSILGVFSRPPPDDLERRFWIDTALLEPERPVSDCAEPGLAGKLAAMGYTHVLVRADYRLADMVATKRLKQVKEFEDATIFEVRAAPAPIYTERIEGFSWRSANPGRSVRWMGPSGLWRVINTAPESIATRLEIELTSFHHPRSTSILLDDRPLADLEIGTRMETYHLGPIELAPGAHELVFVPAGKPTAPSTVIDTTDQRPLTIAVGSWTWTENGTDRLSNDAGPG